MDGPISSPPLDFLPCRPRREGDGVSWRVWAPRAGRVELVLNDERHAMTAAADGHFVASMSNVAEGTRYGYSLDGGPPRPDPCSVSQPEGVHRPSALCLPEIFPWRFSSPTVKRGDLVIYELHVGTFTDEGTFAAAIDRIDDLVDLGVNAVEVLPVAQFPGRRNWGYDGVHPGAAQHSYGGPREFQRFIDAAHGRGLAVFLDVVFNHLGPEGNYLEEFGPYFSPDKPTPWGPGFDFDGPGSAPVRRWVLECVWQWIYDFRLDGLRLDAVHAMQDDSSTHILADIKSAADLAAEARGGGATVIAESLLNDVVMVTPRNEGGYGLDAEWNEDFHHAVSAWMTGERHGKYVDYGEAGAIETVLRDTFHLAGRHSHYHRRPWGKPAGDIPGNRFVISLQNHDHVGNRDRGERIAEQVDEPRLRLGACLTLLSPFLPMLFMGEEYGETRPFRFFCDFGDEGIIRAVRKGRRQDYALAGHVPDPQDEQTFLDSRLSWRWRDDPARLRLRELYRDLIRLRMREPGLRDHRRREAGLIEADGTSVLRLVRGSGAERRLVLFHLGEGRPSIEEVSGETGVTPVWRSGQGDEERMAPFETVVVKRTGPT